MTKDQWKDLEGKVVYMTVLDVASWGDKTLKIECKIHETDDFSDLYVDTGEDF